MAVWVWAAVCIAWIVGVISNFLVAPTNTRMNLADSYSAFQTGSNVGNVVALLLWSGASFWTGLYFSWSQGPVTARVLAAFGMTAVLSLYPASVVSAAVGHVVPIEDDFVYQDWLARPLLAVGVAALAAAAVILIVHARRR